MNLIGLALVLFATPSQPQDSLIDLKVNADSMESVLSQLSEQTGFKFEASGDVKDDVVSVEWSDVTMDDALEALASATKGKWTQRNGIAYLGRDSVEMRRDERARADRFEAELQKALKEMEKVLGEGMPKMDGEMGPNMTPEQMQNAARVFRDGMPGNRTAMRLLLSVPRATLAKIAPGERLVFANRNTPMQKPLAVNLPNLVKSYLDDMANAPQMGQRMGRIRATGGEQQRSPEEILKQDGASRVFLIVRRTEDGGSLNIEMALTDPQGGTLASGFLSTGQFNGTEQRIMTFGNVPGAGVPALPEQPAPEGNPIELSPELKETLAFFGGRNGGGGVMGQVVTQVAFAFAGTDGGDVIAFEGGGGEDSEPVSKTWSDLLSTPDENEPLGWFVAPLMRAATPENDYVIWLSDSLFAGTAQRFAGGKLTDKEYETWFKGQGYESMAVKGTQVQRPVDLAKAAAGRVNRKALATALQAGLAQNSLRLNQIARYSTTSAEPHFQSGLDIAVASRLDGLLGSQLRTVYGADRTALQIWDQLPANQRPVPTSDTNFVPVTVFPTRMGGKINDNLFWNVFNDDPGPTVERQQNNSPGGNNMTFRATIGGGGAGIPMMFGGSMLDERTEVLPRGIPGETLLNISARGSQVLKAMTGTGGGGRVTTAGSLGSTKAAQEAMQSATQGRINMNGPELTQFRVGSQVTYTFTFQLARGVTMTRQLRDADFSGSTVSNFSQLPTEMQAEFTKAYNETKQRMANMTQRMGNGNQQAP